MKKVFALLLSVAMVICMMPGMAFAADDQGGTGSGSEAAAAKLGTVTELSEGLTVAGEDTKDVKVTIEGSDQVNLPWVEKDSNPDAIGGPRPCDGWWVGVWVAAPEGITKESVDKMEDAKKPTIKAGDGVAEKLEIEVYGDKEGYGLWQYVNKDDKAKGKFTRTYVIDWKNGADGAANTQTITLDLDMSKVMLEGGAVTNLKAYVVEQNEASYNQLPASYLEEWPWAKVTNDAYLPWLVIEYSRNTNAKVYYEIKKDGETVVIKEYTPATGGDAVTENSSPERANSKAYQTWSFEEQLDLTGNAKYGTYTVNVYEVNPRDPEGEKLLAASVEVEYKAPTETPAKVASGENTAKSDVDENTSPEMKTVATDIATALGSAESVVKTEDVIAAARDAAQDNKVDAATTGKAELEKDNVNVTDKTVTIVVQPYMDMKVTEVTADKDVDTKVDTFTVEITPMYRTVATTANLSKPGEDEIVTKENATKDKPQNAVVIGAPKELNITEPVTMEIPLPSGFATKTGEVFDDIYVKHDKGDTTPIYEGTVIKGGNALTFTNPHGFSKFTVTKSIAAKAKIGDVSFETLQGAVNAAKDNDEIILLADGQTAEVSKAVTFTVKSTDGQTYTATITAASGYTLKIEGGKYTVTKNPPTGGGIYTPSAQKPEITTDKGATVALDSTGTKATITVAEGYEIVDVTVNGVSKGAVKELTGLKAGDKVVVTTKAITSEPTKEEVKAQLKAVNADNFYARSKMVTMKNGKKAIKVTWNTTGTDVEFDGVEIYRSTKRYSGYGKKPVFRTTKDAYYNTAIKAGTKYYYKVRGYVEVEGEKIYTGYSSKAWRTVK